MSCMSPHHHHWTSTNANPNLTRRPLHLPPAWSAMLDRVTHALQQHLGWFSRPRRIFLALLVVFIMHMFDLRFTLLEHAKGEFVELNPFAAALLGKSVYAVAAYKILLLGAGGAIIWSLRKHSIAESGSYLLVAACMYLTVRWHLYFGIAPEEAFVYLAPGVTIP